MLPPTIRTMAALVLAALSALGTAVWAQVGPAQEGFKPVSPEELNLERLPATPLVFIAYAFVWVCLLAYVFLLWRRLGRIEREMADVQARLRGQPRSGS